MGREALELKAAAVLELKKRKAQEKTVFGIVSPKDGLLYSITQEAGEWIKTDKEPDIYVAEKAERIIKSKKRFIVVIGGRGSTKSVLGVDIAIADAKDNSSRTYFLREFQSSIKNSVHSLVKSEVTRFGFPDFQTLDNSIKHKDESVFEFAGIARNIDSVKSTHGFKRFEVEEAQFISQTSLDVLTPSLRKGPKNGLPEKFKDEHSLIEDISNNDMDDVSIIFVANPRSSADPFSKRFIEPYKKEIDKHGYYEDDLHLIVKINHYDNPWFEDSGLESERAWDYENRDRAFYLHKWEGEYNDSIDGSIIKPEWFDAAVDAHKLERLKKVFEPHGAKVAAHDPFDDGNDAGGYALRHGSIIKYVKSKESGEIDEVCDWATGLAHNHGADMFVWDGDGMGTGLKRQISIAFDGTKTKYRMFKGSLSGKAQENAYDIYMPQMSDGYTESRTYAETFKNNRARFYTDLAARLYNTYRCVIKGEYIDPDEMISFDSDGIDDLTGLRSQVCRIPLKDHQGGLIQIMSKKDMKALGIDSPNESDSVMMSLISATLHTNIVDIDYESEFI